MKNRTATYLEFIMLLNGYAKVEYYCVESWQWTQFNSILLFNIQSKVTASSKGQAIWKVMVCTDVWPVKDMTWEFMNVWVSMSRGRQQNQYYDDHIRTVGVITTMMKLHMLYKDAAKHFACFTCHHLLSCPIPWNLQHHSCHVLFNRTFAELSQTKLSSKYKAS